MEYISHTEGAAKILENLIERGECKHNEDGTVSVIHGPNVIMNNEQVPKLDWTKPLLYSSYLCHFNLQSG